MARSKTVYICQSCEASFPKWSGNCAQCGEWNTLVETAGSRVSSKSEFQSSNPRSQPVRLTDMKGNFERKRLSVGSGELKQVVGGGLVSGSVNLLAGEPGIGKSTLLSQMTLYFASKHGKVLYVCGEESVEQVKMRLDRLSGHKKTSASAKENILLLAEVNTQSIVATMVAENPKLTIVDSIQSLVCDDLTGMAGSVGQVRESGNKILNAAKPLGLSTFLVGHVTKGGTIAGPKVLEHMVDTVLSLTGERSGSLRILRAMKNRFGAVDEVGVFEMSDSGLVDVTNPSSLFLEESQTGVPGACVSVTMEGTRPLLVEIQALAVKSSLASPRRVAEGVRLSRLNVICAVLQKRAGLKLHDKDVFVNVAGGIRAHEPAVDLAIALAIAGSVLDKSLPEKTVAVGEVGLLGEVRRVSYMEKRIKEAKKLGYNKVVESEKERMLGKVVGKLWR